MVETAPSDGSPDPHGAEESTASARWLLPAVALGFAAVVSLLRSLRRGDRRTSLRGPPKRAEPGLGAPSAAAVADARPGAAGAAATASVTDPPEATAPARAAVQDDGSPAERVEAWVRRGFDREPP